MITIPRLDFIHHRFALKIILFKVGSASLLLDWPLTTFCLPEIAQLHFKKKAN